MKIAILGGTYNPVHLGHLALAEEVCKKLSYDKVLFVPTFCPPHKIVKDFATSSERLHMLKIATENDDRFDVETCEIDRKGISYTYDTICFLQEKYKNVLDSKIGLIFGQDLVAEFDKWKNYEELAKITDIILAFRKKDNCVQEEFENAFDGKYTGKMATDKMLVDFAYPHTVLENDVWLVSSTEIRQKISLNENWENLVPCGVCKYIKEKKLYGYKDR